jgi:hypothetical protein
LCTVKSDTLKISPLLAKYLYTNKELILEGIGRFTLNAAEIAATEDSRLAKSGIPGTINFQDKQSSGEDDGLVVYVAAQTGKMKSLAAADLNSHLELARQFLNIGKPFLFEGIGTLSKNKAGQFEFLQEGQVNDRPRESQTQFAGHTSTTEDSFSDYEAMLSPKKPGTPLSRRMLVILTLAIGIGLAVLGGYLVYNNGLGKNIKSKEADTQTETILVADSASVKLKDTALTQLVNQPPGTYRFVIEQATRKRALDRFSKLKSYGVNIKLETKDSVRFKLYFLLAAAPADTARIRDSLALLYTTIGKARVE